MASERDSERWLTNKLDLLRMRVHIGTELYRYPANIRRPLSKFDPNEYSCRGEPLLIALVRYEVVDPFKQVRLANMLLRSEADVNLCDKRRSRSALMWAAIVNNKPMADTLLAHPSISLTLQDRVGNTAPMYAVLSGATDILQAIIETAVKRTQFHVFAVKNCMGQTARGMAVKNCRFQCVRLLDRRRMDMLQRMHRQLALIHLSAQCRGWQPYCTVQKAASVFCHSTQHKETRVKNVAAENYDVRFYSAPDLLYLNEKVEYTLDKDSSTAQSQRRSVISLGGKSSTCSLPKMEKTPVSNMSCLNNLPVIRVIRGNKIRANSAS